MRAVIFAGGSIADYDYTARILCDDDLIIAADSGFNHLQKIGIKPAVMIGDMDSVSGGYEADEIVRLNVMKDETDTEAAAMLAVQRGADEILILGGLGSRQDHSIANALLLKKLADMGVFAYLANEKNEIYFLNKELAIAGKSGDLVSILPLCELSGIVTKGLFYALDKETLHFGAARGVSNVMTENKCLISAESGCALVIKSRD